MNKALHETDNPLTVRWFCRFGANPNVTTNKDGSTPLHFAVTYGGSCCIEVVNALLAAKANINAKDKDNHTPLQTATLFNTKGSHDAIIKHLNGAGVI